MGKTTDKSKIMSTEEKLRKLLWLRHGCPISSLYGDDGEMQCSTCLIDFKRADPDKIQAIWEKRNLDFLRAQYA